MTHIVSTVQIIELLRANPEGMLAAAICAHFNRTQASLNSRLSKLAAYGIIRQRTTCKVALPNGKTSAASVRHFLPPEGDEGVRE